MATFAFRKRGLCYLFMAGLALLLTASSPIFTGRGKSAEAQDVEVSPQEAAFRQLEAASEVPIHVYFRNGFPNSVLASVPVEGETSIERSRNFLETYQDLYLQVNSDLELIVRATEGDADETVIFSQTYKGVKVYGAQLLITLNEDRLLYTVGTLLTQRIDLDVNFAINDKDAEAIALNAASQPDAPIVAETSLLVFDPGLVDQMESDPHLAWRVLVAGETPFIVFVDAHNSVVLASYSLIETIDLDLEDANGTNSQSTNCYWWTSQDDQIGDEDGVYPEAQNDQDAVAAYNAFVNTFNWYNNTFGYESYDDDDGQVEVYVHAGVPNASWQSGSTDCDLIEFANGWVGYDIMVHEFTHGVTDYRSVGGFISFNQPGALNEHYSDAMAALADGNWQVGETTTGGVGPIRNMADPTLFGDPDRMSSYVVTSADNGGVHINNGIMNKAMFLISNGGNFNNVSITGIGTSKVRTLYFGSMFQVSPFAQFLDARNTTVGVAHVYDVLNIGGFTPQDVCQVRNAFAAVELGNPDLNCDGVEENTDNDNDTVGFQTDNCPNVFNPFQDDLDQDGIGDFCDPDYDGDGVPEMGPGGVKIDNCPGIANPDQTDANFNGIGAACDPTEDDDNDDDGVLNDDDNCLGVPNADQADVDNDGDGDACDPDHDGDGLSSNNDNCPYVPNADQANTDGDAFGDDCDKCPNDVDTAAYSYFENPITGEVTITEYYKDSDGDGIPDTCDNGLLITKIPAGALGWLQTDCDSRPIDMEAMPRTFDRIPILLGDDMMDGYSQDTRIHIMLEGLPPDDVHTWILDDEGRTLDEPSMENGSMMMDFRPLGGQLYYLMFNFGPEIADNEVISFTSSLHMMVGDEMICTPRIMPPQSTAPVAEEMCLAWPGGGSGINVRNGPGPDFPVNFVLGPDESAQVIGRTADSSWWQLMLNGMEGWSSASVITLTGPCDGIPVTGEAEDAPPAQQPPPTTEAPPQPAGVDCAGFFLIAPRDGLNPGGVTFSWQGIPGAEAYRVMIFSDGGSFLQASWETPAPNTSVGGDVSQNTIGPGTEFVIELQALVGGGMVCSERLTLPRFAPGPVCGDAVCEASEMPTDATGRTCTVCPTDCTGIPACP